MYHDNEYHDADRYDSSADRKEDQKQKQLHEKLKQQNPELYCSTGALQSFPVNDWLRDIKPAYRPEYLFGDLWRPGDVTVLAGETGVGKSILAVQIAESIARGKKPFREPQQQMSFGPPTPPVAKLFPHPRRQRVLYLDLETSPAKMRERYTCPSPILGKLPVSYRFAAFFERSGYAEDLKAPEHFRGDMARYLRHSVDLAIRYSEANVFIIDDLAALEPSAPRSNGPARWLRNFRKMAALHGCSILVLTHLKSSPPRPARGLSSPPYQGGVAALGGRGGSLRPLSLTNLSLGRQVAELADTVVAIGRTTFGPEYRYIKVLKSKNGPRAENGELKVENGPRHSQFSILNSQLAAVRPEHSPFSILNSQFPYAPVLAFQLERTTGFSDKQPCRKRLSAPNSDSSLVTHHSSLAAPLPFLGFTYLGPATEHDLIRDHTADLSSPPARGGVDGLAGRGGGRLAQRAHERSLKRLSKRSSKEVLVDGVIDGSYMKYLKGER